MRPSILLLVFAALVFGSCTTAYKTGQTPDDVYFSPQRPQEEYVNVQDDEDNRSYRTDDYYGDQYLRMKVRDRMMWSTLDDWYDYAPSYGYYNSWNWNNPWSPSTYWNYYYNPYCSPVILGSKGSMAYNHPRIFNLNTYNNTQLNNKGSMVSRGNGLFNTNPLNSTNSYNRPVRVIGVNNSRDNSNSGTGTFLRNIFNGASNNNNSSNNSNNSSFSNQGRSSSSGSSGSSSSSSGGSAPVRRF